MRKVLLSLHPAWCKEIFVMKRKVIEVRKTVPKLELPFEVLVYQTKHKGKSIVSEILNGVYGGGKVIGSFVCDTFITDKTCGKDALFNGAACLTQEEVERYSCGKVLYGWHITEPKLFNEPLELKKFIRGCDDMLDPRIGSYCGYCPHPCFLTRPPQSWCYIEV